MSNLPQMNHKRHDYSVGTEQLPLEPTTSSSMLFRKVATAIYVVSRLRARAAKNPFDPP